MNYELFMGEALAEARNALARGERPIAAVAVVDDAMVARAHDRVEETNDPTAHAVVVALRDAARKLGRARLGDATIFTTLEPCAMCVGALLESDVEALVYALPTPSTARQDRSSRSPSTPACRDASGSSAGSAGTRPRSCSRSPSGASRSDAQPAGATGQPPLVSSPAERCPSG